MTGIQALERAAPTLPLRPGQVERREFEYVRHGTQALIANFVVATGAVVTPSVGPTRTEADFATHIDRTIALDPDAAWIFVADHLDTHRSETLVRLVAARCGITDDLLRERIPAFIAYFNRTMAKPFKWTYAGRPLTA